MAATKGFKEGVFMMFVSRLWREWTY
jgi:hypothetical protein